MKKDFYPAQLREIEVNKEKILQYFGKKSFIQIRYNEKEKIKQKINEQLEEKTLEEDRKEKLTIELEKLEKELSNGLLKTCRHFYLSWSYVFFFSIILSIIMLAKICSEKDKNRVDKIYVTAQFDHYGKNEIRKDTLIVKDDSVKVSLSVHIKKNAWIKDIYSTDNIFVSPLFSQEEEEDILFFKKSDELKMDSTKIGFPFYYNKDERIIYKKIKIDDDEQMYVITDTLSIHHCNNKDTIIIKDKNLIIKDLNSGCKIVDFKYKNHEKIDVYSSLITVFSMLMNVFLLSFFGLLKTKTDVFRRETNEDDYSILKLFAISIFIITCVIEAISIVFPISLSLHFVIETIVAVISVMAIFGVWGSMNNQYTNLEPAFKLIVFIYAAAQIFTVFLSKETSVNETIGVILLWMVLLGKMCIMLKMLNLVVTKRLSWFFLNEANEQRTNDYNEFVKLLQEERKT
ncbi:MAG: hypothetical protein LBS46_06470 [Dysgonamonadaceae bacterium]|nr:hypothetical protein [Dysgonamonadaceae bacterium]